MKGRLEEMMSRARFVQGEFYVQYRDFKELIQLPAQEFWKIAEIVPTHRIARILERIAGAEVTVIDPNELFDGRSLKIIYQSSDADLLALPVVVRNEVDPETLRFVEMRDALSTPNPWQRYLELERIKRLEDEGRELLGEVIYIQEKRDGENISIWLESGGEPHVSSHNMVNADPSIVSRLQLTPEYARAVAFLKHEKDCFNHDYILYGELVNKGRGATRIEPNHKHPHWILFDIYDVKSKSYLPYTNVYQHGYHWKIQVVNCIETWTPYKYEDLDPKIDEWKKWAKKHRREGVVGKVYKNGFLIGFKEKIDIPDLPAIPRQIAEKATFPPMPEDRILRAILHALDEVGKENWEDKSKAMPVVAKHLTVEAREHSFNVPRNIYEIYLDTLVNDKYKNL